MTDYVKIEKFQCEYCYEEFTSEVDAKDHIVFAKHCNNGLVCEPIPNHLKVIRVKHAHHKTYSLARVEGFSHDSYHKVKIYLDRWCHNRDSDHFPENETSYQCSTSEILSPKELHEYTLDQMMPSVYDLLTEEMVTEL
jgi:hypothetical protein